MKHTPTPWHVDVENDRIYSSGLTVCRFDVTGEKIPFFYNHEPNAHRIVQCVNAMAEVENPLYFMQRANTVLTELYVLEERIKKVIKAIENGYNLVPGSELFEDLKKQIK
jgi:hypothetical protein